MLRLIHLSSAHVRDHQIQKVHRNILILEMLYPNPLIMFVTQ